MRPTVTVFLLATLLIPAAISANPIPWGGPISAYSTPDGSELCLYDTEPGTMTVFIVHNLGYGGPSGVVTSRFAAPKPDCLAGTHVRDITPPGFVSLGDSQTGIIITYGGCRSGPDPFLILTIEYQVSGATPPGCEYAVIPDPDEPSGEVIVVDCSSVTHTSWGSVAYINGKPGYCAGIAAESSTWSRVKSLYR